MNELTQRMSNVIMEGRLVGNAGYPKVSNPYAKKTEAHVAWVKGWFKGIERYIEKHGAEILGFETNQETISSSFYRLKNMGISNERAREMIMDHNVLKFSGMGDIIELQVSRAEEAYLLAMENKPVSLRRARN